MVDQSAAVDIDLMHGEGNQIMFNVNIDNPPVVNDEKHSPKADTEDYCLNLLEFGSRDYWQYNKETLSGERVDPILASTIIKESGITCQDYIVVWHKNYADVLALRHLLARAGVQRVLPPDDHIIRLPYLFRHNLDYLSQGGAYLPCMLCNTPMYILPPSLKLSQDSLTLT